MADSGYDERKKQNNAKYLEKLSRITVWLTPEEKEKIKAKAEKENLSVNSYIRSRLGLKGTPIKKKEKGRKYNK